MEHSRITLAAHIKAQNIRKQDFATMIGVSPGQLSRWLAGKVVPDRLSRKLLYFATDKQVDPDGWA